MHISYQENKKLLFQYEVLRSRLDIREFFLKTIVKDVYENIGQVLSLVRMQLAILNPETVERRIDNIVESGNLVGQSIKDLRSMCKSFYPDNDVLEEDGLTTGLINTIKILNIHPNPTIKTKGAVKNMSAGLKLYVFKMLQEILISMEENKLPLHHFLISYKEDTVSFIIDYLGNDIEPGSQDTEEGSIPYLSFKERVQLLNANFDIKRLKTGKTRITFKTPINISYEQAT